jgi:hypothetical protein
MNHWHTFDQLAAGRLADLTRESAGDVRLRAATLAGPRPFGDPSPSQGGLVLVIRRLMAHLRTAMAMAFAHRRHDLQVLVAGWQHPGRNR